MKDIDGKVQEVLKELIHNNNEIGLQVCAYLGERLVVDAWAGLADEHSQHKVDGETLFTALSISKGIISTCIHLLAERGLIDYDKPIAEYWPEFAAGGKEDATIRHALTHRVGIPNDPPDMDTDLMSNWNAICQATAEMPAICEPGTKIGYHPLTYGWILGEVIHRVDGRSISQFLQDEVCRPLAITDMYFGVPAKKEHCVATLKNAPGLTESLVDFGIPMAHPMSDLAGTFNLSAIRRAAIPGAGLIVNARSLARHYAMLASGGTLEKIRLFREERIKSVSSPEPENPKEAEIRWWTAYGLGYTLGGGPGLREDMPHSFGYEGVGTIGFADPDRKFSFAILKNLLDVDPANEMIAAGRILETIEKALGIA